MNAQEAVKKVTSRLIKEMQAKGDKEKDFMEELLKMMQESLSPSSIFTFCTAILCTMVSEEALESGRTEEEMIEKVQYFFKINLEGTLKKLEERRNNE